MTVSSQEPRGTGLSTSLVSDFRAILNALEKEKGGRPADDAGESHTGTDAPSTVSGSVLAVAKIDAVPVAPASDGENEDERPSEPTGPMVRERVRVPRGETPARPEPMALSEVRSRISALGDVRDMFPHRAGRPAAEGEQPGEAADARPAAGQPLPQPAPPARNAIGRKRAAAVPAVAEAPGPRRRAFGASGRAGEAETPVRRRKSTSSDVITWQRLGILAICAVVFGGGLVALQRVVGREEAVVAPDEIGNAAIASVAPSTSYDVPAPTTVAVAPPVAAPATLEASTPAAPASVADVVAEIPKLNLRDAEPVFDTPTPPAAPAGVTAFAPPEPPASPRLDDTAVPADAATDAASAHVTLPKQPPLPPVRQAALDTGAAPAADTAAAEPATDEVADDTETAGGGDPVGTVLVRSSVTMRSAPRKGASALANLQGGEKVDLVACHGWCEVIADGKRGFVYKSFLNTQSVQQQADAAAE
ncbi:SH3 domain-containing protein [Ancylobacter mangrovi]|uniref:SH3 domain-containing protein n=1 Tax=Ancylobacter mangrovi TaxID=2972472 RepID=UPI002162BD2D|nr:SH3 domain-containing protein [Ancylobacter mangrovi]MCS0504166.1 SH3 domain-containing protein [Ancylobacter mangrovi]